MSHIFLCFNYTATPEIYTLSLHDALPISPNRGLDARTQFRLGRARLLDMTFADFEGRIRDELDRMLGLGGQVEQPCPADRKSTRLNSSHVSISYAVFCLIK